MLSKAVLISAFVLGAYAGYHFLTTSPRFAVSHMEFEGFRHLSQDELREWLGPVAGENIFLLNLEKLSARLTQHPWIRNVSVKKQFPQGIRITVRERFPYARVQRDQEYVMDNFGVILETAGPQHRSLPLIIQGSASPAKPGQNVASGEITRILQAMHDFNRLPFFQGNPIDAVEIQDRSRLTFHTRKRQLKIVMDPATVAEGYKNFLTIIDAIEDGHNDIEHIDLSFQDQVVVQRKGSRRQIQSAGKL